jgi:hypothetical protein
LRLQLGHFRLKGFDLLGRGDADRLQSLSNAVLENAFEPAHCGSSGCEGVAYALSDFIPLMLGLALQCFPLSHQILDCFLTLRLGLVEGA